MRNLEEYPITLSEMRMAIDLAQEKFREETLDKGVLDKGV